ncbi:9960_t:CDS:2 [Diversispora eburnea]|uniref:9960_t:CDS:1 n=1 Tax=Diversispora eburnea TaxID=1213867 RepID=A0A9N9CCP6_9GLOM|nr:9960_t:CDS:2 [Diversispora eburnea]
MEDKERNIDSISKELTNHLDFFEPNSDALKNIQKNVETVTNQVEEIKVSLEHVRSDTDTRSEVAAKELYDSAHHLDALYDKIDSLERFIDIVKQTVNDTSERVIEAEGFLMNPINRVLDTIKLSTAKSIEPSDLKLPPMKPLNIYQTSDYFPKDD